MDQATEPGPHTRSLRIGRVTLRAAVYLVTTVTEKRRRLFEHPPAAERVAAALRHYHDRGNVHGFGWVVMPDHVHWLLQLRVGTLDWLMRAFKTWTAAQVKRTLSDPPRRVWQPHYHDRMVRPREKLDHYINYLVANPLRWNLARHPRDYPYLYAESEVLDVFGTDPAPLACPWQR